ncbi:hypothetical protein HDF19_18050 [Mucilaginibacter sp. E4BP6]|uniref:hypothetical protein n=1 Tax=Mucilaginibacter sp. E4BP6 TaxID=2723089 RepID=UPI0015C781FF|nr:hypothetical protein [Mucilaginibacter sp. E4BP6]NYE66206.1 hypothetical protein [Mucilaginibacter sp. E4BP6]
MRKIKEAQENEKKQDRADQQNHFQEALPVVLPVSIIMFNAEELKIVYPSVATPEIIRRSYSILLPPKIV